MPIQSGQDTSPEDVLNIYNHGGNVLVGKNGKIYIPVYINNATGEREVRLAIWGKAAGASSTALNHGISQHTHDATATPQVDANNVTISVTVAATGVNLIPYTGVPQAVQIWIDGTEYTGSIGDENSKGATMYDSANEDWGINGTTEWDTGWLTLDSEISWTAGWHYIELKETGGTGGVLIYQVSVNAGANQT